MAVESSAYFFILLILISYEVVSDAEAARISKLSFDRIPLGGYAQSVGTIGIGVFNRGIDSRNPNYIETVTDKPSYPTLPPSATAATHPYESGSISHVIVPDSTRPSPFSNHFDSTTEPLTGGLFHVIDTDVYTPDMSEVPMDVWLNLTYIKTPIEFLQMIIPDLANTSDPEIKILLNKSDRVINNNSPRPNSADVGSGGMASPANCEPRDAVVEIPAHRDPFIYNWPSCTIVKRCGGCCYHTLLECIPKVSIKVTRKVIQVRYPHIGAKNFEYRGVGDVELEQDEECTCTCRTKQENCNDKQEHKDCQCVCKNKDDVAKCKGDNMIWNNKDCKCECKDTLECPNAQVFNSKTCKCQTKATGRIIDFDSYLINIAQTPATKTLSSTSSTPTT